MHDRTASNCDSKRTVIYKSVLSLHSQHYLYKVKLSKSYLCSFTVISKFRFCLKMKRDKWKIQMFCHVWVCFRYNISKTTLFVNIFQYCLMKYFMTRVLIWHLSRIDVFHLIGFFIQILKLKYILRRRFLHCDLLVCVLFSLKFLKIQMSDTINHRDVSLSNNQKESIGLAESHYKLESDQ